MGERAAYKVTVKGKSLFMVRKQWYLGSTHNDLKTIAYNVAKSLMVDRSGISCGVPIKIGDGMIALREDLGIGRLSMALLLSVSSPPFDELVESDNLNCDISDHGIFEIEMLSWNHWQINHYPVTWSKGEPDRLGEGKTLCSITFEKGKTLEKGTKIKWYVPDDWEYPAEEE